MNETPNEQHPAWKRFLTSNPLSRRTFIRRTGAASVATLMLTGLHAADLTPPVGQSGHCRAHGAGPCRWIHQININFTSATIPPEAATPGPVITGSRWHGTMTVVWMQCDIRDGNNRLDPQSTRIPVYTGGHKEPDGNTHSGPDSACPLGDFYMQNATGAETDPKTCGNVDGFPVHDLDLTGAAAHNGQIGGRSNIEVHAEGPKEVSEGCIVLPKIPDPENPGQKLPPPQWAWFAALARNTVESCIHEPSPKIPLFVRYPGETKPIGNTSPKIS